MESPELLTKASAIVSASGNTKLEVVKIGSECSRSAVRSSPTRIAWVSSDKPAIIAFKRRSRSIMKHQLEDQDGHPQNRLVLLVWLRHSVSLLMLQDRHHPLLW